MPSKYTSPFATSFRNAIGRGMPCSVAVENIAKRNSKTPKTVFESLFKAGLCFRQKINGQFVYWPCDGVKGTAVNYKACQVTMWQNFVDWCICSGCCTPEQLKNCCGSQNTFMTSCRKFFNRMCNGTVTRTASSRRTTTTAMKRSTTVSRPRRRVGVSGRSHSMARRKTSYRRAA